MFSKLLVSLLLVLFSSLSVAAANDQERVTLFLSDITVNQDASIDTSEIITVYATQNQIKYGIVRFLPTHFINSYGIVHPMHYQVKQILMNEAAVPYFMEYKNNQLVIFIGDKNNLLTPGYYTYAIRYHVAHAVNFFKEGDGLYWNITGNQWPFPIAKTTASITLPDGVSVSRYAGYTGRVGEKGRDYTVAQPSSHSVLFTATRPLQPGESLTVAIGWPKGFMKHPSLFKQINTTQYFILYFTLVIFIYYFLVWSLRGSQSKQLRYLTLGILLSLAAFVTAVVSADDPKLAFLAILWLTAWTAACYILVYSAMTYWREAMAFGGRGNLLSAFLYSLVAVLFLLGELAGLVIFTNAIAIFTVPLLFLIVTLNVIFYDLLRGTGSREYLN